MAVARYCIPENQSPATYATRAAALGCANVNVGDPTSGVIAAWPSVVVVSSQLAPAIFPDNTSQASAASVAAALAAANSAEASAAAIVTGINNNLATLQAWIAANPSGAVLTAAQTLVLADMLVGIGQVLLVLTAAVQAL